MTIKQKMNGSFWKVISGGAGVLIMALMWMGYYSIMNRFDQLEKRLDQQQVINQTVIRHDEKIKANCEAIKELKE